MASTDSTTSTSPKHVNRQWLRPEPRRRLPRLQSFERRRANSDGDRRYHNHQNNHYNPSHLNPSRTPQTQFLADSWSDATAAHGPDTASSRIPLRSATVNNPATKNSSQFRPSNRATAGGPCSPQLPLYHSHDRQQNIWSPAQYFEQNAQHYIPAGTQTQRYIPPGALVEQRDVTGAAQPPAFKKEAYCPR